MEIPKSTMGIPGPPTAEEARAAVLGARAVTQQSARIARSHLARESLILWGVVWLVGYLACHFLPLALALLLWPLLAATGYGVERWWQGRATVRNGWEQPFLRAWWVTILGSFALAMLVATAAPPLQWLVAGAVWAMAIMQYGVVSADRALAGLGGAVLVVVPAVWLLAPQWAVLVMAFLGGGGMILLGLMREWDWRNG